MWTIVNECKSEMDKINLRLNSVNSILNEIKENNNWFPHIWKRK